MERELDIDPEPSAGEAAAIRRALELAPEGSPAPGRGAWWRAGVAEAGSEEGAAEG